MSYLGHSDEDSFRVSGSLDIIENGFEEPEQTDDTSLQQIREDKEMKRKDRKTLFIIYQAWMTTFLRESQISKHPKRPRICYTKLI